MRCWAEIDLAALERNLALIRKLCPKALRYVSVVKADAYGHGILPTAARLMQSGVDLFAVANVKEAAEIREMASGWPILVLGPLLEDEDSALLDYDLIATLSSASELTRFRRLAQARERSIHVHLKLDTGMGRLGAWWEEAGALIEETIASPEIELCGIRLTSRIRPILTSPGCKENDFAKSSTTLYSKNRKIFLCMLIIHPSSWIWKRIPSSMRYESDCFNLGFHRMQTACSPVFPWNPCSPSMLNLLLSKSSQNPPP